VKIMPLGFAPLLKSATGFDDPKQSTNISYGMFLAFIYAWNMRYGGCASETLGSAGVFVR
jgi:hypothetical protein